MNPHFFAVAAPLKGKEGRSNQKKSSSTADGVLRWRFYTHKHNPRLVTTYPTQTRAHRGNNDWKAAINN